MRIYRKLLLAFLLMSLVPLAAASILAYVLAERALRDQVLDHLESVAAIQRNRIEAIRDQNLERLALIASRTQLRISLSNYKKEPKAEDQARMNAILLDAKSSIASFEEISILSLEGQVVASTNEGIIGVERATEEFFLRGLEENSADIFFLDDNRNLKIYLSGPLYLENTLLGVLVVTSAADNILAVVQDYSGLGNTGETVLATRTESGDALLITPLRSDPDAAALTRVVSKDDSHVAIAQAFSRREGSLLTEEVDYRGEAVVAASQYIPENDWALVVKIRKAEAFAPIVQLRNLLIGVMAASAVAVVLGAAYVARIITKPITNLIEAAGKISEGDLTQRAMVHSTDEIGTLARAFNQMTESLVEANANLQQRVEERTQELAQAVAELEDFTYVVSHDLKEPLRGIEAFSTFLAEDFPDKLDEQGQRYISVIRDSAVRMRDLIEDLLELARIGQVKGEPSVVAVGSLLEDVRKDLAYTLQERNVDLRVRPDMPSLVCDPVRIKQVFENLIANAIKFNDKPQPVIELTWDEDDSYYTFSLSDNGPGIDERYHEKIFQVFQRLGRREEAEGTGIGLALCRKIVEAHGGRIWAESKVGQGSTFSFTVSKEIRSITAGSTTAEKDG